MIKVLSGLLPILCYNGCVITAFFGRIAYGNIRFFGFDFSSSIIWVL